MVQSGILVGNSFPLTLIRRSVNIKPAVLEQFLDHARHSKIYSFWGHKNTLTAAKEFSGLDVGPSTDRPVLTLSDEGFPMLDGMIFRQCWVLSPDYRSGFRPAVGEEVETDDIIDWQILKMDWGG